jgi:hypothetical protein
MANEMRDRLATKIEIASDNWWYKASRKRTVKHLSEYIADCLLDDGWVRPPCKVGDTVYIIGLDKKIEKHFVEGICLYQNGLFIEILYNGQGFSLPLNKVFLTKEEAEQKLKEMRGE